jgi:hypothetical protein
VGVGTPKSRDEMGEGGDDFYSAQRGRCADLHYIGGGGGVVWVLFFWVGSGGCRKGVID